MRGWREQRRRKELRRRIGAVEPMELDRLLECFTVDEKTPLLRGVLHVLRAIEETAKENAVIVRLAAEERAQHTAVMGAMAEAQETILELLDEAHAAARGEGPRKRVRIKRGRPKVMDRETEDQSHAA